MFTWIAATLAGVILAGACIIYWDDIKKWALDKFNQIRNKVTIAYANLIYRAGCLYEKIFGASNGKIVVIDNPEGIQNLTLEELYEAYKRGELTYEQINALEKEMATQVAEISN